MKNITPFLFAPGCLFDQSYRAGCSSDRNSEGNRQPVIMVRRVRQIEADWSPQVRCPTEAVAKCEEAAESLIQRLVDLSNVWYLGDAKPMTAGKDPVKLP